MSSAHRIGSLVLTACLVVVAPGCTDVGVTPDDAISEDTLLAFDDVAVDPGLEALANDCVDGDGVACDDLWGLTEVGSDYERLAASCGNRVEIVGDPPQSGDCANVLPTTGGTFTSSPTTSETTNGSPGTEPDLSSTPPPTSFLTDGPEPTLGSPSEGSWIVILFSISDEDGGQRTAFTQARLLSDRVGIATGVFPSSDFPELNPGFWVVYTAPFDSADDAIAACEKLRALVPDCYHRQVG